MTTPKEALEGLIEAVTRDADEPGGRGISGYTSARLSDAKAALASLQGEDAVERVARAICLSGKFETGQGTCALICMDQLGGVRKKGCGHCRRVHGAMARAILATGLVPDEAAIRADQREIDAKIADEHSFGREIDWWLNATKKDVAAETCRSVAAAIRSGGVK